MEILLYKKEKKKPKPTCKEVLGFYHKYSNKLMLIFSGGFSSCSDSYCCHTVPAVPEEQGGCETSSPSLGWRVCLSLSCRF